ncbi:MAG: hypothetical protein HKM24_00195 [Gammaproteobacteria bacterium]|nr:hypothetical protein [Gammaproteobacteria bacterium]
MNKLIVGFSACSFPKYCAGVAIYNPSSMNSPIATLAVVTDENDAAIDVARSQEGIDFRLPVPEVYDCAELACRRVYEFLDQQLKQLNRRRGEFASFATKCDFDYDELHEFFQQSNHSQNGVDQHWWSEDNQFGLLAQQWRISRLLRLSSDQLCQHPVGAAKNAAISAASWIAAKQAESA